MRIKLKNFVIILAIICFVKLHGIKSNENIPTTYENHHVFLQQITDLKDIMKHLEKDIDNLHNGLQQQADIIYIQKAPKLEITTTLPHLASNDQHEQLEEFYENVNIKLTKANNVTENSMKINNNSLTTKIQKITQLIESLNKCVINNQNNDFADKQNKIKKISEQLEKQIKRINVLKEKVINLNKYEEDMQKKSENLSKMMSEILTKLESQDGHFSKMENQLPVLQGASKALDDYITRRNERFSEHRQHHQHHHWHHRHHS